MKKIIMMFKIKKTKCNSFKIILINKLKLQLNKFNKKYYNKYYLINFSKIYKEINHLKIKKSKKSKI